MEKINNEKTFKTDKNNNIFNSHKHHYKFKFTRINGINKKILQSSPEKECISINELVKKSVDKINNLFQQQKLSESDDKSFNSIINLNLNNRIKYRENTNFHTINTIEEINKYRSIKNEKQINERKSDDDLSENVQYTNSHSFVDVSALKRNIKQHSFDFKNLFQYKKESKNQIDYIQKSNQNEKKYLIQNVESYATLFNPKTKINLKNSQDDETPIKTKKSTLFQSEIIKDLSNGKYLLEPAEKTEQKRRKKYYSFYKNNQSFKNQTRKSNCKNSLKNNYNDISNTNQKQKSNKNFFINYKRTFSTNNKCIKNERYNNLRNNNTYNSFNASKNSTEFNFNNTRIQNMNEIKIYPSPNNEQKKMFKSKTQNHFNNTNNSKILKQFYSKEFPIKIKTNDILKLMLFLNEYIINNNLLDDYYIKKNRKILDDYSKFLAEKIDVNYPKESDVICDDFINKTKIIQRNWRKLKVIKYLENKKFDERNEMKKMIINSYIEKTGYQIKKFFGTFHNLIEQFTLLDNNNNFNIIENNINKSFYFMKKIITKNLSSYEKNELYRDYINKVIYLN